MHVIHIIRKNTVYNIIDAIQMTTNKIAQKCTVKYYKPK